MDPIKEIKEGVDKVKSIVKGTPKFTRDALINSLKFKKHRDAIMTLMKENERLTLDEIQAKLDKFYKTVDSTEKVKKEVK